MCSPRTSSLACQLECLTFIVISKQFLDEIMRVHVCRHEGVCPEIVRLTL